MASRGRYAPLTREILDRRIAALRETLAARGDVGEDAFQHLDCDGCDKTLDCETEDPDGWVFHFHARLGYTDLCPVCRLR